MADQKIVLVTGASSGFGELTAQKLAEAGCRVFGTSRQGDVPIEGIEMLELDVTSDDSVQACVDAVFAKAGRLDVLINNAGRSHCSLVEETSLEDAALIFDTNFWGVVRMIQVVLPKMREMGSGLIINVSSIAGLVGTPGQGFYAASKHALEGYTETLRAELGALPVEIALVEPGFFKTNFHAAMMNCDQPVDDYDGVRSFLESRIENAFADAGDPAEVAETILGIVNNHGARLRYLVGKDAKKILRLKKWLPESWFIGGMRRQFGLEESD